MVRYTVTDDGDILSGKTIRSLRSKVQKLGLDPDVLPVFESKKLALRYEAELFKFSEKVFKLTFEEPETLMYHFHDEELDDYSNYQNTVDFYCTGEWLNENGLKPTAVADKIDEFTQFSNVKIDTKPIDESDIPGDWSENSLYWKSHNGKVYTYSWKEVQEGNKNY